MSEVPPVLLANYDQWQAMAGELIGKLTAAARDLRAQGRPEPEITAALTETARRLARQHRLPPEQEAQELAMLFAAAVQKLADVDRPR